MVTVDEWFGSYKKNEYLLVVFWLTQMVAVWIWSVVESTELNWCGRHEVTDENDSDLLRRMLN